MNFPWSRPRRLRKTENIRKLVRETSLSADNFIYPLFIVPGKGVKKAINSMPGCFHLSADMLKGEIEEISALGIPAVLIFGVPDEKSEDARGAYTEGGLVQEAIREIKKIKAAPLVATDVCLCSYTKSGHCGIVKDNEIDNDLSVETIAKTALSHAKAGADIVAPSDMMDGRVKAIRMLLEKEGLKDTVIMSYAAKYASAFYGPFRDAADSAPQSGDRKNYQMAPANAKEALKEMRMDIDEGADIVMVKPALAYLDIISRASEIFDVPIAAYSVSGEYSMIKAAAAQGLFDEQAAMMEALLSMKRAGARIIITYYAKEAAKLIKSGSF